MDSYYNLKKPELRWDYKGYDGFINSLSFLRKKRDEIYLKKIFNAAAKTDQGRDALNWAKAHKVKFIVDRSTKADGYYHEGMTGVVAIKGGKFTARAINILVHELTHARQDYLGFITTNKEQGFNEHYMKIALIEADAFARGDLAEKQYNRVSVGFNKDPEFNEDEYLWDRFKSFYSSWKAPSYGEIYEGLYGCNLGIVEIKEKNFRHEYDPYKKGGVPVSEGINIINQEDVRQLGNKFGGGNYFPKESRDFIQKVSLSSLLAFNFYKYSSRVSSSIFPLRARQSSNIKKIRKTQLKLKFGNK